MLREPLRRVGHREVVRPTNGGFRGRWPNAASWGVTRRRSQYTTWRPWKKGEGYIVQPHIKHAGRVPTEKGYKQFSSISAYRPLKQIFCFTVAGCCKAIADLLFFSARPTPPETSTTPL